MKPKVFQFFSYSFFIKIIEIVKVYLALVWLHLLKVDFLVTPNLRIK
jgi:hypothetical protein